MLGSIGCLTAGPLDQLQPACPVGLPMGADGLLQNLGEADPEVILVQRGDTGPEGTADQRFPQLHLPGAAIRPACLY